MWKIRRHKSVALLLVSVFIFSVFMMSGCGSGSEAEQASTWTLVNPEGVQQVQEIQLNTPPSTLEGKTVALRWNIKENGDNFLDRIAELLEENVKDVKVIKLYEEIPETVGYGPSRMGPEVIDKAVASKPVLIIGSQAD